MTTRRRVVHAELEGGRSQTEVVVNVYSSGNLPQQGQDRLGRTFQSTLIGSVESNLDRRIDGHALREPAHSHDRLGQFCPREAPDPTADRYDRRNLRSLNDELSYMRALRAAVDVVVEERSRPTHEGRDRQDLGIIHQHSL